MISSDERDDLRFVRLEAAQAAVLDQVIRVTMVTLVADVYADLVEQSAILEPLPFLFTEAVCGPRLIEDAERETCHLLRVLGPVAAAFAKLDDAASANIRIPIGLLDSRSIAVDIVEHQSFPQREIAQD